MVAFPGESFSPAHAPGEEAKAIATARGLWRRVSERRGNEAQVGRIPR